MDRNCPQIMLSQLAADSPTVHENLEFINEQPFAFFARATSKLEAGKCLFIGGTKYASSIDDNTSMVIMNPETYASIKDLPCGFAWRSGQGMYFSS